MENSYWTYSMPSAIVYIQTIQSVNKHAQLLNVLKASLISLGKPQKGLNYPPPTRAL